MPTTEAVRPRSIAGEADHSGDSPGESPAGADAPSGRGAVREVRHLNTRNLPDLLAGLRASVLISTYQAGKLVVVGSDQRRLALSFHNFERAMGLAVGGSGIAVGTRAQVWMLRSAPQLASRIEPAGRHDACFLTRSSQFTGEFQSHEICWSGEELWVVNTAFSCLCTLDRDHSFVPRWRPQFISALAPEDRCHLNGLAMLDGRPRYVTAMSETDAAQGWRQNKVTGGCLIDVRTGQTVVRSLAMPHSPRVYHARVLLLNSGFGRLVIADPATGKTETVIELPGYTRGLAFCGHYAFVGLSRIRETSTFGGMPIAEKRKDLKCGLAVVDLRSGALAAHLEFVSGVEEVFDVQVVPGVLCPAISGPYPTLDDQPPVWTVPVAGNGAVGDRFPG